MEKKNTGLIILVLVLGLGCLSLAGYIIYDKVYSKTNKENEIVNNKEESKDETTEEENKIYNIKDGITNYQKGDTIEIYFDNNLIYSYPCDEKKCEIIGIDGEYEYQNDELSNYKITGNVVLIGKCDGNNCDFIDHYGTYSFVKENSQDGNGTVDVIDLNSNTIKTYNNIKNINSGINDTGNLMQLNFVDGTSLILNNNGKINNKYGENEIIKSCYEGCIIDTESYNLSNGNIVLKNSQEKYGIKSLLTNKIVIEYIYDEINLSDNYFIAKQNNQYNIYKYNGKSVTKKGYDLINILDNNTILVYKDKEVSFIDYNENKLIEETIKVNGLYPLMPKNPKGINVRINNNVANIIISTIENETLNYSYNLKTKELKKIEQ